MLVTGCMFGDLIKNRMMFYFKKHTSQILLIFVLLISFLLMFYSARSDSITNDEKVHISAGYLHVWKGDYTFNTEHPPLLNDLAGLFAKFAKPNMPEKSYNEQWKFADMFFYESKNDVESLTFWARLPFIFLTLGLIYLVFLWARTLFGEKAGLIAAVLTAFSPNILAHGRLATTDIGVAFFFLLSCWFLRKYYLKTTWVNVSLLGSSLGLTLLSKFSGMAILPVILLGLIFIWIKKKPKLNLAAGQFLLILLIPIILIWFLYAFSMREYLIKLPPIYELSRILGNRTLSYIWSEWLIVPFDKFIQGLEIISDHNKTGHLAYLNGQVGTGGWWYYFPLTLWYKMTLAELALLGLAISHFFWKKIKKATFFDEFLIIFSPLFFLAISMVGKIDIGLRHILPILPFFYIFISRLILSPNLFLKKIVIILTIVQVGIGILAFPNYLAYFNQIAGGAKGGIKHLADSNIDWNQNMKRFGEYAKKHNIKKVYELCGNGYPFNYYGIENDILPKKPVKGVVVICAHYLVLPLEEYDIDWVIKSPPDDIVSNGVYVWRFDEHNY